MFERNKVDASAHQQVCAVPIEMILSDASDMRGKLFVPSAKSVSEVLNGPGAFLEFEPYGGERTFLAKAAVRSVKPVNVPVAQGLGSRAREIDPFDPYRVLGIAARADWEDVRQAYHRLAKAYHPDRYASIELPEEVRDYLSTMARRLNLAYAALEVPVQETKKATERPAPVYTSPSRG